MIGNWDNTGCVFAVLPACLKNGSNPSTYAATSSAGALFPVYNGPESDGTISGKLLWFDTPFAPLVTGPHATYDSGGYIRGSMPDEGWEFISPGFSSPIRMEVTYQPIIDFTVPDGFTLIGWFETTNPAQCYYSTFAAFGADGGINPNILFGYQGNYTRAVGWVGTPGDGTNGWAGRDPWTPDADTEYMMAFKNNGLVPRLFIDNIEYFDDVTNFASNTCDMTSVSKNWKTNDKTGASWQEGIAKLKGWIYYNRTLSDVEIAEIYALGPDLGGLQGFDNGDGTMRLSPPSTPLPPLGRSRFRAKTEGKKDRAVQEARDMHYKATVSASSTRVFPNPKEGWKNVQFFHSRKGVKPPGKHQKTKERIENFKEWLDPLY